MKLGLFGGTFNPVHNGHLTIASGFMQALGLDRVLFIPTALPPHKQAQDLASEEDRVKMLRLAVEPFDGFEISDMELRRKGKSYTFDTVTHCRRQYPGEELFLIVGSDMFLTFHEWYRYREILGMVTLCGTARTHGDNFDVMETYAREVLGLSVGAFFVKSFDIFPVSSSEIRENVKKRAGITGMTPEKVEQYIKEKRLYLD